VLLELLKSEIPIIIGVCFQKDVLGECVMLAEGHNTVAVAVHELETCFLAQVGLLTHFRPARMMAGAIGAWSELRALKILKRQTVAIGIHQREIRAVPGIKLCAAA